MLVLEISLQESIQIICTPILKVRQHLPLQVLACECLNLLSFTPKKNTEKNRGVNKGIGIFYQLIFINKSPTLFMTAYKPVSA